jgi:hypothetical protein
MNRLPVLAGAVLAVTVAAAAGSTQPRPDLRRGGRRRPLRLRRGSDSVQLNLIVVARTGMRACSSFVGRAAAAAGKRVTCS